MRVLLVEPKYRKGIPKIGKNKDDMMLAHKRMKEIGGGIVLAENGKIVHEIPLQLSGCASTEPFETVLQQESKRYASYSLSADIHLIVRLIHLSFSKAHTCHIFE